MSDDFLELDAVAQSALVSTGEISALELLEAMIGRIEPLAARLGFLASERFDQARQAAEDRARGGRLEGTGLLLKDLIDYPQMPFTLGSRLFAGHVSEIETPYARQLAASGVIPLGRTTTSELGLLGSTESALHGPTLNPWDPGRSAGGSSGGAAAAVACRAVPLAHGSDGGGSIRIPASINGVFGLKPSAGRTPTSYPAANHLTPLVSDHCLSLSVRDSAAFLAATERTDRDAPLSPVGFVARPLSRTLTIGYYTHTLVGREASGEVLAALEQTLELCRGLGHEPVQVAPPALDGKALSDAFFTLAASVLDDLERMLGFPLEDPMVEPFTLALLRWYRSLPGGALERASAELDRVRAVVRAFSEQHDVLLTPTVPVAPPGLGYLAPDLERELLVERMEVLAGFTPIQNMAGLPAMSVPLCWSEDGLPLGSHFFAGLGKEGLLLELAYQLEEACPWRSRRPPICA